MQTIKNQGVKLVLLALVPLALLSGCTPAGPRALLKGEALLEQGKFAEALDQFKIAASLLPTNAQAFNYLGLALHHAGRLAEAEKAYLRALALNRELAEVHYNLGCLWLSQNKLEPARGEFTAYTLRQPGAVDGWVKLGTVQLRTRDPVAAERSFNEALRLKPQCVEALTDLGLARTQRNRPLEAVQCFQKALQQQADFSPALLNLAIVTQEHLKDKRLALERYQQYLAVKPAPENSETVQKLVQQLQQELNAPLAVTNALPDTFAQKNTNAGPSKIPVAESVTSAPSVKLAGAAQTNQTRTLAARMEPDKAQARATNTTRGSGSVASATNPPKTAATTDLAKARDSTPLEVVSLSSEPIFKTAEDTPTGSGKRAAPSNFSSSSSSTVTENRDSGTSSISSVIGPVKAQDLAGTSQPGPAGPPPARYVYKLPAKPAVGQHVQAERPFGEGVQAQSARHLADAIRSYRQAIQLDPAYFDAYYNLGLAAIAASDLPLALATYETALALRPDSSDARYNFALALKQSNYPIDAANELQKLLTVSPNESRAHLMLGNLYAQQLHQPAKARQHYLKVLETDPGNPQAAAIQYWLKNNPL